MPSAEDLLVAQIAALTAEEKRKEAAAEAAERRAQEEHEARLAQLRGAAGAVTLATTGEKLPDAVIHIAERIPGLDPRFVKQIMDSTFDPLNLCKLCYFGPKETAWTEDLVGGQRVLTEKKPTASSFGPNIMIWSRGFTIYQIIIHHLFATTHPEMAIALVEFSRQVQKAAERYGWQEAVLPMALHHMGRVSSLGTLVAANWVLPANLLHEFCTSDRSLAAIAGQAKWASLAKAANKTSTPPALPDGAKKKATCNKFNSGSCERGSSCFYDHRCKECDSTSHGSLHHQ
jgi:hypothetical protein